MTNQEIYKRVSDSPNTNIHTIFHVSSQINSEAFYDLVRLMEYHEIKDLLPECSNKKIKKAIKENNIIPFLYENGLTGFIAEVYHTRIIGIDGEEYIYDLGRQHISIFHDEDYNQLIERILERSEYYRKDDLENVKRKEENATK